jgi:hypothetical protein
MAPPPKFAALLFLPLLLLPAIGTLAAAQPLASSQEKALLRMRHLLGNPPTLEPLRATPTMSSTVWPPSHRRPARRSRRRLLRPRPPRCGSRHSAAPPAEPRADLRYAQQRWRRREVTLIWALTRGDTADPQPVPGAARRPYSAVRCIKRACGKPKFRSFGEQ